MPIDSLTQTLDGWSIQVVVASQYLSALYRRLGDEKQAIRAIQAATFAEERCRRSGLQSEMARKRTDCQLERLDDTEGEATAWRLLLEGQAALFACLALLDEDTQKMATVRGKRRTTAKGFQMALQGLRTAFPEELTAVWISVAVGHAAEVCTTVLLQDLEDRSESMEKDLHASIIEALEGML